MNAEEWAPLVDGLNDWWPGRVSDRESAAYLGLLGEFDVGVVRRALRALARRGVAYRPTPAEVAREIGEYRAARVVVERRELERYAARVRAGVGVWAGVSARERERLAAAVVDRSRGLGERSAA